MTKIVDGGEEGVTGSQCGCTVKHNPYKININHETHHGLDKVRSMVPTGSLTASHGFSLPCPIINW